LPFAAEDADEGEIVIDVTGAGAGAGIGAAVTVTAAEANLLGSAVLVAVTTQVAALDGAV